MNPIVGRHDVMKRQQVQQLLIAEGSHRSYYGSGSLLRTFNRTDLISNLNQCFISEFFIDKFVAVARRELAWECDYIREAAFARKFK